MRRDNAGFGFEGKARRGGNTSIFDEEQHRHRAQGQVSHLNLFDPDTGSPAMRCPLYIAFSYENCLPTTQADAEVFLNTAAALFRRGMKGKLFVPCSGKRPELTGRALQELYQLPNELPVEELPSKRFNLGIQHAYQAYQVSHHLKANLDSPQAIIYSRSLGTLIAGLVHGFRVFFDHYRPWGDQIPPLQPVLRQMMLHPNFIGGVIHSEFSRQSYLRIGIPEEKLRVAHNGYEPTRLEPIVHREAAKQMIGLEPKRPAVVYTGRINAKKGLEFLLDMAKEVREAEFILVGSEGHGEIEAAALSIPNVRIVPWQTFRETAPYLYAADVLMIPPSDAALRQGSTVLPLKVYTYLGAGRAIMAPATPDTHGLLVHGENACLVKPGDLTKAVDELRALFRSPEKQKSLEEGARRTAAAHTWDCRAARIQDFLEERIQAPDIASDAQSWTMRKWLLQCQRWFRHGLRNGTWIGMYPSNSAHAWMQYDEKPR